MVQTLKERAPQEYEALVSIYEAATEVINDPDYERASPPLNAKPPFSLLTLGVLSALKSVWKLV